ncbi:MAG: molybdopterin-synthase adenylyltransferase MoeB [Pseudomonadota bacterium]
MALFLTLAAGLWGLGYLMKTPRNARWILILLLYLIILAIQIVFPDGHPLRVLFGGTKGEWFVIGALGLGIWAYSLGLKRLRGMTRPENKPKEPAPDESPSVEVERNARHIVLREIGGQGQKRLKAAKVLVIGAGGLGAPALQYLGAAGVGTLGVVDDDVVSNDNLQRQVIHTDARIGMPKVFSAQTALEAQNPFLTVRPYNRRLTPDIAEELIGDYDLVLDGTDDPDTRYAVNAACVATETPLISGALSAWEGQVTTFAPHRGSPCYRCVFPNPNAPGLAPSCAEGGVLGPLPGVIGSMMAVEATKELTEAGDGLAGRLIIYDALYAETRTIRLTRDPKCPVCGA